MRFSGSSNNNRNISFLKKGNSVPPGNRHHFGGVGTTPSQNDDGGGPNPFIGINHQDHDHSKINMNNANNNTFTNGVNNKNSYCNNFYEAKLISPTKLILQNLERSSSGQNANNANGHGPTSTNGHHNTSGNATVPALHANYMARAGSIPVARNNRTSPLLNTFRTNRSRSPTRSPGGRLKNQKNKYSRISVAYTEEQRLPKRGRTSLVGSGGAGVFVPSEITQKVTFSKQIYIISKQI